MLDTINLEFKVMGYCGDVIFLSTSTTSSYCTVALTVLKTTQFELVILASIARAERSTTHVDANLQRQPPPDFSCQKSDLARKI